MTTGNTARIRNLVETARSAINENNHDTEDVDQEDFASVVSATFRDFRRRRQPDLRQTKRGRKASSIWKARVFLLKRSNVDFLPSIAECKYLDDNGYGSPKKQDGTATILMVNRSWPLEQFKLFLCEQYPQMSLGVVGFKLAKCDKGKKIKILETSSSVRVIEKAVGRGKLLLIPDQDLVFQPSDSGTPTIAFRSQRAASVLSVSSPANDHQSAVVETPLNEQPSTSDYAASVLSVSSPANDHQSAVVETPPNEQPLTIAGAASVLSVSSPANDHQSAVVETPPNEQPSTSAGGFVEEELPEIEFDHIADVRRNNQMEFDVKTAFFELNASLEGEMDIKIPRDEIVDTLVNIHTDSQACKSKMNVTFDSESGQDLGGLTKEAMTMFWNNVTKEYFTGEHVTVPCLPLHRERKEKWKYRAFGRALTHTVALTGTLPCRLAISGFTVMVFDSDVNPELLMQDFLLFITPTEKALVGKALNNFSSLSSSALERLTTFMSINGLLEIPKASEIQDQILAIAEAKLIKEPRRFYALMKEGIPEDHLNLFWNNLTIEHLKYILECQRPTPAKVVAALKTSSADLRAEEECILYFLKEFVCSLDIDDLMNFLMFVTGSIHMPVDGITVSFVATSGILRRPVAHTCSCTLELSIAYSSLQEFRREMKLYLANEYSYQYTLL